MVEPVRFAGRIIDWNDEKGFGFVVPSGGGERAFVHVSEFRRTSRRPVDGDLISYRTNKDTRGRLQAREIRHAGERIPERRQPSRVPRMAIGFVALVGVVGMAAIGTVPLLVACVYGVLSGLSYLMYWWDKSAAQQRGQRTPENSLHVVDLLGGWPGALIAQQQYRHKTIKQPFQSIFWITVLLNLIGAGWLTRSGIASELSKVIIG